MSVRIAGYETNVLFLSHVIVTQLQLLVSSDVQIVAYLKDSGVFEITFPQQSKSHI